MGSGALGKVELVALRRVVRRSGARWNFKMRRSLDHRLNADGMAAARPFPPHGPSLHLV
jgi:hypothetical protein